MRALQLREARRLLSMSVAELASRSGVPSNAIYVFERTGHMSGPADRVIIMKSNLESAGVVFTDDEELGVQLRKTGE